MSWVPTLPSNVAACGLMCIRFLLTESSSIGSVAKAAADATQDVERLRQRMDSEYQSAVAPAKVLTTC